MTAKRIAYVVLAGLAFVGGIVLLVLRQSRLAGLLRAAADGALIKHDLKSLQIERAKLFSQDVEHQSEVMAINRLIATKEAAGVAVPMRHKGATEEEIDAELRTRGLL